MRRDLNVIVGGNGNWNIPRFWPLLLRYISAPILAIIFSFAYPEFHTLRYDPLMIVGFIVAHICLLVILLGFVMPRYYSVFIPPSRQGEGTEETIANEPKGQDVVVAATDLSIDGDGGETGLAESSSGRKSLGEEEGKTNQPPYVATTPPLRAKES